MKKYYKIAKVFGINIVLHYSWFFIFIFLSYALSREYFPMNFPDLSTPHYWFIGTLAAVFLFVSVLLHELCHSLVAKAHNIPIKRIQLFFFGGVAEINDENIKPWTELQMALAGPAFSILFGLFCFAIQPAMNTITAAAILHYLSRINLILGIFNLMPGFPLDGGRALRAFLWLITKNFEKSTYIATRSGKIFGALLALLGLFAIFSGNFGGLWFVLIGGFLYFIAEMSFEQVIIKKELGHVKVSQVYKKQFDALHKTKTVGDAIDKILHSNQEIFPVLDSRKNLQGIVSIGRMRRIPKQIRHKVKIHEVMLEKEKLPKVNLKNRVYPLLLEMTKNGATLLPVTKGKKVIGVISKNQILHYLRVKLSFDV